MYYINYVVEGLGKINDTMFKVYYDAGTVSATEWTDCTKDVTIDTKLNKIDVTIVMTEIVNDATQNSKRVKPIFQVVITNKFKVSVSGKVVFKVNTGRPTIK